MASIKQSEKILHEKLLVAKVIMEAGYSESKQRYSMTFDECLKLLLSVEEIDSVLLEWYRTYGNAGDWEEHMYPLVSKVLNLPRVPQKWVDTFNISEQVKLTDPNYVKFESDFRKKVNSLVDKYRSVYEKRIKSKEARGFSIGDIKSVSVQKILVSPRHRLRMAK